MAVKKRALSNKRRYRGNYDKLEQCHLKILKLERLQLEFNNNKSIHCKINTVDSFISAELYSFSLIQNIPHHPVMMS